MQQFFCKSHEFIRIAVLENSNCWLDLKILSLPLKNFEHILYEIPDGKLYPALNIVEAVSPQNTLEVLFRQDKYESLPPLDNYKSLSLLNKLKSSPPQIHTFVPVSSEQIGALSPRNKFNFLPPVSKLKCFSPLNRFKSLPPYIHNFVSI